MHFVDIGKNSSKTFTSDGVSSGILVLSRLPDKTAIYIFDWWSNTAYLIAGSDPNVTITKQTSTMSITVANNNAYSLGALCIS